VQEVTALHGDLGVSLTLLASMRFGFIGAQLADNET
jgi:hypothetical protein